MDRSYAEHDAIISAIRQGNDVAGAAAMHNHVIVRGDRFRDLVAALPPSSGHTHVI